MKNATRYCAGSHDGRMPNRRLLFKQTGSSSTKGNHHPSFLRLRNWAEENRRCSQNLWRRRKNVVKTENPANICKWIVRFYYLGIYTPLEARVYCSQ